MRLLFVCTGNRCRSPIAERLTVAWVGELLGTAAGQVRVSSAGLRALPGRPMHPHSAKAVRALGAHPDEFTSRPFSPEMVEDADLVLVMTRNQRRKVLGACPRALRRTFTLPEAAVLLGRADLAGVAETPLPDRARVLATRLDAARAWRPGTDSDDVRDPVDQPARVHVRVAERIASDLRALIEALFGASPAYTGTAEQRGDLVRGQRGPRWLT